MAATEQASNSASNPPYLEMILAAVTDLGEKGSSKTDITEYIEGRYSDTIGEGYPAAISATLAKLEESGDLLLVNDVYMIPSLSRRGRGRPKKVKPVLPPGALPPTPRPRGRPPKQGGSQSNSVKVAGGVPGRRGRPAKPKDSNAAVVKVAGGVPRRRGRPAKPKDFNAAAVNFAGGVPRRRGRPAKPKDSNVGVVKVAGGVPRRRGRPAKPKDSNVGAVKRVGGIPRRPGRPSKKHLPVVSGVSRIVSKGDETAPSVSGVKRRRGRPAKVKLEVAD